MFILFLTSGLFLGWSLGANDAANIFGSAVGSKMVKFSVAVFIASIFVILGSFIQGSGASDTLGELGSVNAIGGAFTVALCAGLTVFWMTKLQLPVSSSQGIIGAIIGWNFYSGNPTDMNVLGKIVGAWVAGPILGAVFAILLYLLLKFVLNKSKIHLIKLDAYLKYSLLIVGAFGAYSLGANNVANVVGVFIPSVPEITLNFGIFILDGKQLLFLIGGIAIASGIITYSKKVMMTVGNNLMKLSAESALVIVLPHSLVLFIFSSDDNQKKKKHHQRICLGYCACSFFGVVYFFFYHVVQFISKRWIACNSFGSGFKFSSSCGCNYGCWLIKRGKKH